MLRESVIRPYSVGQLWIAPNHADHCLGGEVVPMC